MKHLSQYPHTQDMYIGKPSLDRPIEATERLGDNKMVSRRNINIYFKSTTCFFSAKLIPLSSCRNLSTSGSLLEAPASA